ncbi:MAG TPA: GNAT family N-acetyltransferase [Saprospiraceae bacterium]|nr:GNAT family N-acetyltransferase [Saprospiraceae bacterium]HPI06268.1 GNAT family N-acetyltransferase [Saprospiraceae bacterium]
MDIQIYQIGFGTPEYDEAVGLRYEVLRKPLGLDYSPEQLASEYDQVHLAAYGNSGALLAYLNLTPAGTETVKMRQVAVATALQGKGIGTLLVAESERLAQRLQFEGMTLHARETAVPFYERLGYVREGERFEEVGIPHFKMKKALV